MTPRMDWDDPEARLDLLCRIGPARYNALLRKHQRASVVAVVNGYPIGTVGTDMRSKYPNVCVALLGEDENAFAIVERVQRALREGGVPAAEVKAFTVEACSGDYYHLLETVLRTVETI